MDAVTLHHGDALDVLRGMADNSVDAVVTDPPAGISFMGKAWDGNLGGRDQWIERMADIFAECLRVVKPGGHAFMWALPRTSHWTACALEDAGWTVREKVYHLFGSGFPKSHNLPGGIGTALKPAAEEWILARKPLVGTVAANVLAYGTGGLNIEACRVGTAESTQRTVGRTAAEGWGLNKQAGQTRGGSPAGRWPPNVVLSHANYPVVRLAGNLPYGIIDTIRRYYDGYSRVSAMRARGGNYAVSAQVGAEVLHGDEVGATAGTARDGASPEWRQGGQPPRELDGHGVGQSQSEASRDREGDGGVTGNEPPLDVLAVDVPPQWQRYFYLTGERFGCQRVGTRRVRGGNGVRGSDAGNTMYGGGKGMNRPTTGQTVGYADADGLETVDNFACVDGCPVKALAEQSGERKGGTYHEGVARLQRGFRDGQQGISKQYGEANAPDNYGDTGTAARFFPNFEPSPLDDLDAPWLYTAKASRREREAGLSRLDSGEIVIVQLHQPNNSSGGATWASEGQQVRLLVDTGQSQPKVIGGYGIPSNVASEWNTFLFGSDTMGLSRMGIKSITATATNSTTTSPTWNYLMRSLTNASIAVVNSETASGGSHADDAGNSNLSLSFTSAKTVFLPGASDVLSGTRWTISVSAKSDSGPSREAANGVSVRNAHPT